VDLERVPQETLVLVFTTAALAPLFSRMVERLRAARGALALIERGDLAAGWTIPSSTNSAT